jgi:hypothetical protein
VPISLRFGEPYAMQGDINETIAPDENPYNAVKTIIEAFDLTALQQNRRIHFDSPDTQSTFRRPTLSSTKPGRSRPKTEAALRMDKGYYRAEILFTDH